MSHGCVTNFDHDGGQLTIWRQRDGRFSLMEFGVFGATLPLTYDPVFQSIAAEMYRLACEVGRLRGREIEAGRAVRASEVYEPLRRPDRLDVEPSEPEREEFP